MYDTYASAFYDVVKETQSKTGYDLPLEIESYVVMLLASFIDKPSFLPQNTFVLVANVPWVVWSRMHAQRRLQPHGARKEHCPRRRSQTSFPKVHGKIVFRDVGLRSDLLWGSLSEPDPSQHARRA